MTTTTNRGYRKVMDNVAMPEYPFSAAKKLAEKDEISYPHGDVWNTHCGGSANRNGEKET